MTLNTGPNLSGYARLEEPESWMCVNMCTSARCWGVGHAASASGGRWLKVCMAWCGVSEDGGGRVLSGLTVPRPPICFSAGFRGKVLGDALHGVWCSRTWGYTHIQKIDIINAVQRICMMFRHRNTSLSKSLRRAFVKTFRWNFITFLKHILKVLFIQKCKFSYHLLT